MKEVSLKDLLEAGCHFGHQTTRWNPKMKPYIFMARDGIHIFDLVQTKKGLEDACGFAKETANLGGQILFVGTKRQAQDIVRLAAQNAGMPYIFERWVGGLLTNWTQMKKRLDYLANLKVSKAEDRFKEMTKRENLLIDREIVKMEKIFGGVMGMAQLPTAVFVADAKKDDGALREARRVGIKTIAIVDTNSNPDLVDFVIPANDDAAKSIELICGAVAEAINEGQSQVKVGIQSAKLKVEEEETEKKASRKLKTKTKPAARTKNK